MTPRLIGTSVGIRTLKGGFEALIHKLKLEDGTELLATWYAEQAAQLVAVLTDYRSSAQITNPETETEAERNFKKNEGRLSSNELELRNKNSVVSHMTWSNSNDNLQLNLNFSSPKFTKSVLIGKDEFHSFCGWTLNSLKLAGFLDQIFERAEAIISQPPMVLYTCIYNQTSEIEFVNYGGYELDQYHSRTNLDLICIADNSGLKKIVGGFFLKSNFSNNNPRYEQALRFALNSVPDFSKFEKSHLSFLNTRVHVPDGDPLSADQMQKLLNDHYLKHTIGGSA